MNVKSVLICLLLVAPVNALAQSQSSIEEIIITAPRGDSRVSSPVFVLDNGALVERQPITVADVFHHIPGISIRTNSRGESVVRVRGAEERQTLVFLDGAPLATPWDGRTDLALLPAGLIDRIEVIRGVAPIEYGANAVAGAVDLTTYIPTEGVALRAQVQQGSRGLRNDSALAGVSLGSDWSFVVAGAIIGRDAVRIADKSSVPFDPSTTTDRTNTDLSGKTVFAATSYFGDATVLRASVMHADVKRGVAAQGDIDPRVNSPRFWRTPTWRLTQATLNGTWSVGAKAKLRLTGWQQWFDQTIDAYSDYSYLTLREREQGDDETTGARVSLSFPFDRATVRAVVTANDSTHRQIDSEPGAGQATERVAGPALFYRQKLITAGAELDFRLGENLTSTFGLGSDRAATPLTGDKPAQQSLSAISWSTGLQWTPSDKWAASASLGQRSRFPTPRELYGAALGRFLLNPDLKPERALLGDVSLEYSSSKAISINVAFWANRSDDTLAQRIVDIAGDSRRQRYNTNGSLTFGIEAAATWSITENFLAEVSTALQDGEMERDDSGERPVLLQRPKEQMSVAVDWQAIPRLDLRAEFHRSGQAYDLADNGDVVRLPSSNSINLRGFLEIGKWWDQDIQLTAAVDNLTNELVLPQLGLPAPGRSYHFGIRIN